LKQNFTLRAFSAILHKIPPAIGGELLSAILLGLAAAIAVAVSNSGLSAAWEAWLTHPFLPAFPHGAGHIRGLIGDALMVVFFFTVGLEVKREVLNGNLSEPAARRLPVLAALAGMACPALVYLMIASGQPGLARGWASPAATDIAFAMGVLALVGRHVPRSLRLFLLTVAVVDDIGAVVVIALAYTAHVEPFWLLGAAGVLAAMVTLNRAGVRRVAPYLLLAVALWWCVLNSGVHATVAGVLAALTVPLALDDQYDSPLLRLEHALAPVSGYVIVPLFALAHAGVRLGAMESLPVLTLAIGAGLVLGKPLGVFGAMWAAEKMGLARRPEGVNWLQALGAGQLAGIGFTMSMFIGTLAFPPDAARENALRMGILGGSLLAGALGALLLRLGTQTKA